MITQETKDEIEKEAREYGLHGIAGAHSTHLNQRIQSFKDGAIVMAEKKNTEIEGLIEKHWEELHKDNDKFERERKVLNEQKGHRDRTIADLQTQLESTQAELESVRTALISETGLYTDLKAELSRLKEVAAKMAPILEKFLNGVRLHGVQTQIYTEGNKALIEYQTLLEGDKK